MSSQLLKNGSVTKSEWSYPDAEKFNIETVADKAILSLSLWNQYSDALKNSNKALGLKLEPDQHPEDFSGDLNKLVVIAINFPTFTDGRGFSLANLLRDRYAYKGEIRACGNFIRDQLSYLQRCGFDAFEFSSNERIEEIAKSLKDFSEGYQASSSQLIPLFRRRSV